MLVIVLEKLQPGCVDNLPHVVLHTSVLSQRCSVTSFTSFPYSWSILEAE